MKALYPGTFDPITLGHMDIINRASKICDLLTIGVLKNSSKKNIFDVETRVLLIKEAVSHLNNVEVISFDGLQVEALKKINAKVILKGLRCESDFYFEFVQASGNKAMELKSETLFLMSSPEYVYLSSSLVREIYSFNGDISKMVPRCVVEKLVEEKSKEN